MVTYALVDGGSLNNQDPKKRQAYGSFYIVEGELPFIMEGTKEIARQEFTFGNRTNNEAEYMIIRECLLYCLNNGITDIHIGTDSELVWKQIHGEYKIKDPRMRSLVEEIMALMIHVGKVEINKVPREFNVFYLGH
jgi:ribonuclease HI